jgi:teichoic acid transport system ATP-binding protein
LPSASEVPVRSAPAAPVAMSIRDLAVTYRIPFERQAAPDAALRARVLRRRRGVRRLEALSGVSLDIPQGEILGVIGANGAGKSTLLRAMAGILPPARGRIEVRGQISTLLALGVGFNRNLSGRENVMLGGLAAGLSSKQVKDRYDSIVELADIGDFMDLPMKSYSSGMFGRLAFSVAIHVDPDILLIDEALSAGDAAFRAKTSRRMRELCADAGTIVLVSHGFATIRELASDCIWLHRGRLVARGRPEDVIAHYAAYVEAKQHTAIVHDVE